METSPLLLIKPQVILENYQAMKNIFDGFQIHYAVKANDHPSIICLLEKAGSSFETASWAEICVLLKMKISPHRIIFSNPIKPLSAIQQAVEHGIQKFVFDSTEELDKFKMSKMFKNIQLFFRIRVSNNGAVWNLNQKFGCPEIQWKEVYKKMIQRGISLSGITFHVGSQCESLITWENALVSARRAIQLSHHYGLKPNSINIGGGFPIKYDKDIPHLQEIYQKIYRHIQLWNKEKLGITQFLAEPGRRLVGPAGILKSSIIGISRKEDTQWVHLDSGLFSGMMETIYGNIRYPILSAKKGGKLQKVHLCGPTCDGLDVLYEAMIPQPEVGDELHFHNTGAYTNVYSTHFNGFQPPKVFFLGENNVD